MALISIVGKNDEISAIYIKALKDSSYRVVGEALKAIKKMNPQKALDLAKEMEDIEMY